MQVIGLAGQARVGKSEIVNYLVESHGFVQYAFADPLYREIEEAYGLEEGSPFLRDKSKERTIYGLSLEYCNDPDFVEVAQRSVNRHTPLSPRWILQVWGTEYRRAQDENYWTNKADMFFEAYLSGLQYEMTQERYDELKSLNTDMDEVKVGQMYFRDHPGMVVDGVRFQNEVEWLKEYSGQLWHVNRADRPDTGGVMNHESAQQLPLETGDKLILNTGTLAELRTGVVLAMRGNDIVNTKVAE